MFREDFLKREACFGSELLGGDPLQGGRWAMACCFGLVLVLFDTLLIAERVPYISPWPTEYSSVATHTAVTSAAGAVRRRSAATGKIHWCSISALIR